MRSAEGVRVVTTPTAERSVLRVDPIACDGRGLCAELLPEIVRLDDWGYPVVVDADVPAPLAAAARRAVAACPKLALELVRAPTP